MTRLRYATAKQARLRYATAQQARLRTMSYVAQPFRAAVDTAVARPFRAAVQAVITAALVLVAGSSTVFACPMCFGAEETSMIDGTKLGILVLLSITLAVQGAFVGFFFYLRNRAKRIAEADLDSEWSDLQGVSRTP